MAARHGLFAVVARQGDTSAEFIDVVSTRTTQIGPLTFRRVVNRSDVGVWTLKLSFDDQTLTIKGRYSGGNVIILPRRGKVWHIKLVPGLVNAQSTQRSWNGELF